MDKIAAIATHHKAGTVWMNHTFRKIAEALDIPSVRFSKKIIVSDDNFVAPMIFLASHASVRNYPAMMRREDVRIFHVIRDPRDIIISGMHYHLKSPETWLHRPNAEYGGTTYQKALNALPTDHSRYVFEMEHAAKTTIEHILGWDYRMQNSFECRYEELVDDRDTSFFAKAAVHLGFSGDELAVCRDVFWKQSIFGAKAKRRDAIGHVRSGKARQWPEVFDRALGEAFLERYGDALIKLGYENDDTWVAKLPANVQAL